MTAKAAPSSTTRAELKIHLPRLKHRIQLLDCLSHFLFHFSALTHSLIPPNCSNDPSCRPITMKASTVLFATSLACSVSGAPMFRVFPLEHHPGTSARPITSGPIVRLRFSTGFKSIAQPDNHPYTPSSLVTPSEALAAPRPLRTTYLLSLESNSETHNAKSTSEQSSIVREETGVASRTKTQPTILELETEGSKPVFHHVPCNMHGDVHFHQVRKYADMVIVSIVLTFIGVVALIELWNPVCRR